MFPTFSSGKSEWIGFSLFLGIALVLFFIRPLSPMISRWAEMALCNACIFGCGWFAQEQKTLITNFLGVISLGVGLCALPYLIHLGTRTMSDENLLIDITAVILLTWVFVGLNIHLGIQARKIYRLMKNDRSTQ